MTKVLLMVNQLLMGGGTETHLKMLATRLLRNHHQVGILTTGGSWVSHFRDLHIPMHVVPNLDFPYMLDNLRAMVQRERYQILHAHDVAMCQLAAHLQLDGAEVVMTIHGKYMLLSQMQDYLQRAGRVIAVSPVLLKQAKELGAPERKLQYIPNGIDLLYFRAGTGTHFRTLHNIHPTRFVIGYAARFTLEKSALGQRVCAAIADYVQNHPKAHLLVCGRESQEVVANSVGTRSTICGHIDDIAQFYRACDVVVGTGRVALEAMACGVPTIAVGESQFIDRVTPKNIAEAMATNFGDHGDAKPWADARLVRAIQRVANHRSTSRTAAKEVARIVRQRYSARQMVKQIERVYTTLLATHA